MEGRGIVFHAVLVGFLRGGADVELFLHRHHDAVTRRTVVGTRRLSVHLYGAHPFLTLKEAVEGSVLIHALRILDFGGGESRHQLVVLLLVHLFKVRLLHVEHVVRFQEGDDRVLFLLILGHVAVVAAADTLAILVLDGEVPVDDRHRSGTLVYMRSLFLNLKKSHVDGSAVAVHGGVHLEEEGVGTGIVPAADVLRHPEDGLAVNPPLLPVPSLHLLHPGDHHLGELVDGLLARRLLFTSR